MDRSEQYEKAETQKRLRKFCKARSPVPQRR